jgi:RNA polymerase sigma-70 factor (ECF subfamily)
MPDQDEELIHRALQSPEGDLRAFEEFVRKYQRRIVANCRHITHDPNNAEDLAQEVFVKAFFALRSFEGRSSVRHWLQTIKVNHCLNHLKKEQRAVMVDIDEKEDWKSNAAIPRTEERGVELLAERQIIDRVLDAMSVTLRFP